MSRFRVKELTSKAGFAILGVTMTASRALAADLTNEQGIPLLTDAPGDVINRIVNTFLWVIGILAIIYLIWGGMTYVTAGGDAEKAGKGRIAITNAIIGIIIVALAIVIYRAILGGVGSGTRGLTGGAY